MVHQSEADSPHRACEALLQRGRGRLIPARRNRTGKGGRIIFSSWMITDSYRSCLSLRLCARKVFPLWPLGNCSCVALPLASLQSCALCGNSHAAEKGNRLFTPASACQLVVGYIFTETAEGNVINRSVSLDRGFKQCIYVPDIACIGFSCVTDALQAK